MFDYLERTQKTSDLVTIVDHATTLGSDPIFVEALTKQTSWSIISPHVYKKNNMPYWVLLSVLDDDHTKIHIFGGGEDTNKEIEKEVAKIANIKIADLRTLSIYRDDLTIMKFYNILILL